MIRHIVLFRLNHKAATEAAVAMLASMDGKIPSVFSLEVGNDKVGGERSYEVAIHTTFDDLAGLKANAQNPAHPHGRGGECSLTPHPPPRVGARARVTLVTPSPPR